MNKVVIFIGAFIAIIIVFATTLYFKGGEIITEASEEAGREMLGATLTVDDWSLNPFSGTLQLIGLSIGQPEGFGDDESFSIGEFFIDLEGTSLFDNHIKIETMLIDKPVMNLVLIGDDSNFARMQRNVERQLDRIDDEDEDRISLKDFYLNQTTLRVKSDQYGDHTVTLADIHLSDIGIDEDGVPVSEMFRLTMDAIKPQIGKALAELGIKNKLTEGFDALIGNKLNAELDKLPEPIKNAADKVKDALGGLLKKKKPKEDN